MESFNCNSCGYAIDDERGKFCPNCGTVVSPIGIPKVKINVKTPVPPTPPTCTKCGLTNTNPEARFCLQCGEYLGSRENILQEPRPIQVWISSASPPSTPVQQKMVIGMQLKMVPIAHLFGKFDKIKGQIFLRRDGVVFEGRRGGPVVHCHIDNIHQVVKGI